MRPVNMENNMKKKILELNERVKVVNRSPEIDGITGRVTGIHMESPLENVYIVTLDEPIDVPSFGQANSITMPDNCLERLVGHEYIDSLLLEGLNSGKASPMTREDWDGFRARIAKNYGETKA